MPRREQQAARAVDRLVVIGASAGGIEALSVLVATLPRDFPAPLVVAQHLDPQHPSHLGEILARRGPLAVHTVTEPEPLVPGVVYVVPANRHVAITDHTVSLRTDDAARSKPSIDLLLSSAATVFGENLIAVILTGSGSDGAAGARAVKEAGGTVVIQNPQTARFSAMPRALAPTTVDMIADLERIGPLLHALLNGSISPHEPLADDEEELRAFLDELRVQQGLDFTRYKQPTIRRRLQRRIVATGTHTLAEYRAYARRHSEEYQQLVGSFLIKVTEFFRDPELFASLREHILPELIAAARTRGNELRLWSAGCATGEEAYSLAILVAELLKDELEQFTVRIFATDLDARAVAYARHGVYPAAAVAPLPPDLIARYFTRVDGAFEVSKRVRGLVVFGEHDLARRAPFPHLDLCLCRNVLIYFTPELHLHALQLFAFALRDGGYLALGKSETTSPLTAAFSLVDARLKIYRRQGERLRTLPSWAQDTLPIAPPRELVTAPAAASEPAAPAPPGAPEAELLDQLPVGVVAVGRRYDVQRLNDAAQRLLGIRRAALGEDLLHLARTVPTAPLRAAIDAAFAEAAPQQIDELAAPEPATAEERYLQITCAPVTPAAEGAPSPEAPVATVLLLVTDITPTVQARLAREQARTRRRAKERAPETPEQAAARRQEEIARLEATLRQVIAGNRELLAANAALTSANRALQGGEHEAQSQAAQAHAETEEVVTLNEELQATNEELETLNEELQATMEELEATNADVSSRGEEMRELAAAREADRAALAVILASIGDAVVTVDRAGTPVRTNAAYDALFDGTGAAGGLKDENSRQLPPDETPWARSGRGETFSMQVSRTEPDGTYRWLEANGQPLHGDGGEQGVVVIRNITVQSQHRRLQDEFLVLAGHELRTPLTAAQGYLDLLLRLTQRLDGEERLDRYATAARHQVRRMGLLVNDLVDVERLQSGKLTLDLAAVEVGALAAQAVETARGLAVENVPEPADDAGHTITLDAPTDPLWVRGDAGRLEQVLLNLLANALKHTPPATRVVARVRRVDGEVTVTVRDDGPGIAADQLPHLFERFYQVARTDQESRSGLGLGLFICRQLVLAHGGRIEVQSSAGAGTAFTVWLPLLDTSAPNAADGGAG